MSASGFKFKRDDKSNALRSRLTPERDSNQHERHLTVTERLVPLSECQKDAFEYSDCLIVIHVNVLSLRIVMLHCQFDKIDTKYRMT